jgi:hypothetical protein
MNQASVSKTLSAEDKRRRAALLCCHLTRNLAYFRAGAHVLNGPVESQFLLTVLGNFIDTAVMEWSKLFGDEKGKHHWKSLVDDQEDFRRRLMLDAKITGEQWDSAWLTIKAYRDKFLAHLDLLEVMHIPNMDIPYRMVTFLFNELRRISGQNLRGLPTDLSTYFQQCRIEAVSQLKALGFAPEK